MTYELPTTRQSAEWLVAEKPKEAVKTLIEQSESIAQLLREVEELRAKAARWDWIEDNATSHGGGHGFTLSVFVPHDMEDWGAAIDAARAGEKP